MKKWLLLITFMLVIPMVEVVSALNYGEGIYGLGLYGIGETRIAGIGNQNPGGSTPVSAAIISNVTCEPYTTIFNDCFYLDEADFVCQQGCKIGEVCTDNFVCLQDLNFVPSNCEAGEIEFFNLCFTIPFFSTSNFEKLLRLMPIEEGVLAYQLNTQKEAFAGETIEVTNIYTNEGDLSTEVSCVNYFDSIANGALDIGEPQVGWNKKIESNETIIRRTNLIIPDNLRPGIFLVKGMCELLDSSAPDATASVSIVIKEKETETSNPDIIRFASPFIILGLVFSAIIFLFISFVLINNIKKR